jgi:hypothetical protein
VLVRKGVAVPVGRYVSDLQEGDVLNPVTYEMTPFIAREYCHGVDEVAEVFHAAGTEMSGAHLAPPTLIHIDKIRLLKANCPDGAGPDARIHYEYHAIHHAPVPVGERLVASGSVSRRYEKRGRAYVELEIELRVESTRQLLTSYRDTSVLSFAARETA